MRLAIIGSREFQDYFLLSSHISSLYTCIDAVVSGGARGADSLGAMYANNHGIPVTIFKPQWELYGKGAGFRRNRLIIENCDEVIAFWNGESHGTFNSIQIAIELGKPVTIIVF